MAITAAVDCAERIALMESRLDAVRTLAADCRLCPRECGVDRMAGEPGTCKVGYGPVYSSANLHFGEEPPISGFSGSGTIFLTGCNLNCRFCQNFPISQLRHGVSASVRQLSAEMLRLQRQGAHNINLVSPTHQAAVLFETLLEAYKSGLRLPVVYNSGGYESPAMLKLWDGIVDIYMPDAKYGDADVALEISNAPDYVRYNRTALREMHSQVGVLVTDADGVAVRGLLVRHLVLPGDLAGSREVFRFIAEELSPDTYISMMSQYFPAHRAHDHPLLKRRLTRGEYAEALASLRRFGLERGWVQPYHGVY